MIVFFKKIILNFLYKFLYNIDHKYSPNFNTAFSNLNYIKEINFDLINELSINENNFSENILITNVDREDVFLDGKNYIYESWVSNENATYTDNYIFRESNKRKIIKNLNKKKIKINKKIFLIPYYSNQFGHFIGENLGTLLFFLEYLKLRKKKEKLLIVAPSKKWKFFFQKYYRNNCFFLSDKVIIKKNIIFSQSLIFPKFSVFQNYIITRNLLFSKIENNEYIDKKIFLTSERNEKILNINELVNYFKKKKFIILNPKKLSILKLLKILNSAKIVVSEFASITHNIHISRQKHYYIIMSEEDKTVQSKWFRLTQYYNNFHACLFKPIYFKRVGNKKTIPYQSKIEVDIKKLEKILN